MKQLRILAFTTVAFSLAPLHAADLMQVYHQALTSDPIFAQAQSTWESQKMNVPIAEAGYLPQVGVQANANRVYTHPTPAIFGGLSGYTWQYGYQLTLSQPIFNYAAWEAIKGANVSVKAATASYISAQQSLIQRTATAYFNVLQAYDNLRYTIANKRAVWQQFVTAREQFRVGLIAITDEYDARSNYDQVVAQQIAAQNNLNIQLENLRAITGHSYRSLKGLGKQLPLLRPQPNNIDRWVQVADQQNYAIKAQNYTVLAAMETIKQEAAGGYPTLAVQGGYSEAYTAGNPSNSQGVPSNTGLDQGNLGLQLAYAPIQGGLVIASTKQARYNYATAAGLLEQTHRSVVDQTRSSFLSVLSYIGQVKADKQSIISSRNALAATEAGMRVGTRTMVDVLSAMTTLYQAQQQYADDQYTYINNLIALKAAAGTLSVADIADINTWLNKHIQFSQQTSVAPMKGDTGMDKTPNLKLDTKDVALNKGLSKKIVPLTASIMPAKPEKKKIITADNQSLTDAKNNFIANKDSPSPEKNSSMMASDTAVPSTTVAALSPPRQTMLPRPAAS